MNEDECNIGDDAYTTGYRAWCYTHEAPASDPDDLTCDEIAAQSGDSEALYTMGVVDGRRGLLGRHDSAQYDQGYNEAPPLP